MSRSLGALIVVSIALTGLGSCGSAGGDLSAELGCSLEVCSDGSALDGVAPDVGSVTAPERVARFPAELPFEISRLDPGGTPPSAAEVNAFTRRMTRFYGAVDFFRWVRRHSHGLAESNPWGEPPYQFWWHDTLAVKQGDLVTFRHTGFADNMMADTAQVLSTVAGAYLTLSPPGEQAPVRELVLGYIRGISATLDGNVWAEEDPVVDTIMARGIFHRNHGWELDGGRRAAVDYEPVRHEVVERRHDTLRNAANPTWGDIYVRTKRSKDDFPWLYRVPVHLARVLWSTDDPELRAAALKLYDQLQAFAADIVQQGYLIRAKGQGGEIFIPMMEGTDIVDDFASLVEYEAVLPNAECNAKLAIALIASGETLGNDCGDGISTTYEEIAINRYYGHTGMQWNFHIGAIATALLYGADEAAQGLLTGLGKRMDELMVRDDATASDPRYEGDVAGLLVLAATYGLPLTTDEAKLVAREYEGAAEHYEAFERWDLWSEALADGDYDNYPARESHPGDGSAKSHLHITAMPNLFEYCASPVRATGGAQFIDCELFTSPDAWPSPAP